MQLNDSELVELLSDPWKRITSLYMIQDKKGKRVTFNPNAVQRKLYNTMWAKNVILKARQLGMSTFITILFLDCCLWNKDQNAGIIAHTREDAEGLFKKIKFAYDNLPAVVRSMIRAETNSVRELVFSNGSSIRVGTSLRSATMQYLHISEFGKISVQYPDKAREIISGSLNTVQAGQYVFVESTAEGRSGAFYDMVKEAEKLQASGDELTEMDFRLHFFPWYEAPEYRLQHSVRESSQVSQYLDELEASGVPLHPEQRAWYAKKSLEQKDDMRREFPSTPQEAFEVAHEGEYYTKQFNEARREDRITEVRYDSKFPVYSVWDLGYNDATGIWLFQIRGDAVYVLEYFENAGEPLTYYIDWIKAKPYVYGGHIAPHDIEQTEYSTGLTRLEVARNHGINFMIAPKLLIQDGIEAARSTLSRCVFDKEKCKLGIKALESYRREWDERYGLFKSRPVHDWSSHAADSFRYLAVTLPRLQNDVMTESDCEALYDEYAVGV